MYWVALGGNPRASIPLAAWNVKRFPRSASSFDTLGEMHLRTGHIDRAVTAYRQSLALDPKNEAAIRVLAVLRKR